MAEAIETAIVDLAVKKIVSKGYGAIKSTMDLESEVKKLQMTKTLIEAKLLDAYSNPEHSHAEKDTLEKMSCEVDSLAGFLDVRAARALQKQVMGGSNFMKEARLFFSASSNQLVARSRDARQVKAIKEKLDFIAENHTKFGTIVRSVAAATSQTPPWSLQTTTSHFFTDLVVGRERDRDNIIRIISEDSLATEALYVASIIGVGGQGKSTLARYVYRDERVRNHFDAQFWVDVGEFDVKKILKKMMESTMPMKEELFNCEMDQLPHYSHFLHAIGGRKFLLVLDNIWDQEGLRLRWLDLRRLLAVGAHGSKVLITTRDKKVAGVMGCSDPYMLWDLTKEDYWLLFQHIAFTPWQDPGVEAIGKEIVEMCPNVPLVIRSIGGMLAGKNTIQEWRAFKDDQLANWREAHC